MNYLKSLFLIVFFTGGIYGWNESTHQMIVRAAAKNPYMPHDLRILLRKNLFALELGSIDPDNKDPEDIRSHDVEVAVDVIPEIYDKILMARMDDRQLARQLGRISHYISDINNPMHTEQDEAEQDFEIQAHSRYEDQAEAIKITGTSLKKPLYIKDMRIYIEEVGDKSNEYFDTLIEIYIHPGNHMAKVKNITTKFIINAAQDTSNIFYTIWEDIKKEKINLSKNSDYIKLAGRYEKNNLLEDAEKTLKSALNKSTSSLEIQFELAKFFHRNIPKNKSYRQKALNEYKKLFDTKYNDAARKSSLQILRGENEKKQNAAPKKF